MTRGNHIYLPGGLRITCACNPPKAHSQNNNKDRKVCLRRRQKTDVITITEVIPVC